MAGFPMTIDPAVAETLASYQATSTRIAALLERLKDLAQGRR
jgi:hypothetical protein